MIRGQSNKSSASDVCLSVFSQLISGINLQQDTLV